MHTQSCTSLLIAGMHNQSAWSSKLGFKVIKWGRAFVNHFFICIYNFLDWLLSHFVASLQKGLIFSRASASHTPASAQTPFRYRMDSCSVFHRVGCLFPLPLTSLSQWQSSLLWPGCQMNDSWCSAEHYLPRYLIIIALHDNDEQQSVNNMTAHVNLSHLQLLQLPRWVQCWTAHSGSGL